MDKPYCRQAFCLRLEEVLLNYAEAKYELGAFDQTIADKTINKLRPRAKIANMIVSEINEMFDPQRDPSVNPVVGNKTRKNYRAYG